MFCFLCMFFYILIDIYVKDVFIKIEIGFVMWVDIYFRYIIVS